MPKRVELLPRMTPYIEHIKSGVGLSQISQKLLVVATCSPTSIERATEAAFNEVKINIPLHLKIKFLDKIYSN